MPVTAAGAVNVLSCFRMSAAIRPWDCLYAQLQLMRVRALEPAWRGSGTARHGTAVTRDAQIEVSGSFCSGCLRPWV